MHNKKVSARLLATISTTHLFPLVLACFVVSFVRDSRVNCYICLLLVIPSLLGCYLSLLLSVVTRRETAIFGTVVQKCLVCRETVRYLVYIGNCPVSLSRRKEVAAAEPEAEKRFSVRVSATLAL